jgi:hypothetical protein
MAIYRTGTFVVPAANAALNLNLGFVPNVFRMEDVTVLNTGTITGGIKGYWDSQLGSLTTPMSILITYTAGAPVESRLTTTGILPFQSTDSNLFLPQQVPYTTNNSTNLTITGISKAANASITATHSFTASDIGVTVVTFHGINGMTQMNTLSGVVQSVTSTTSFTVNINSTNFSTYTSGGIANVITGAPVSTLYGNQILNTAEANLGFIGLTIGTGFMGAAGVTAGDTYFYEAILQSPATGP